jgi:hypothetical protein
MIANNLLGHNHPLPSRGNRVHKDVDRLDCRRGARGRILDSSLPIRGKHAPCGHPRNMFSTRFPPCAVDQLDSEPRWSGQVENLPRWPAPVDAGWWHSALPGSIAAGQSHVKDEKKTSRRFLRSQVYWSAGRWDEQSSRRFSFSVGLGSPRPLGDRRNGSRRARACWLPIWARCGASPSSQWLR